MVFKSSSQRKAFWASKNNPVVPNITNNIRFFSYVDGRKLGSFKNLKEVFDKHPEEKKAFLRVMKFRKREKINVVTVNEIKKIKRNK